jgi:hypothetical protein
VLKKELLLEDEFVVLFMVSAGKWVRQNLRGHGMNMGMGRLVLNTLAGTRDGSGHVVEAIFPSVLFEIPSGRDDVVFIAM